MDGGVWFGTFIELAFGDNSVSCFSGAWPDSISRSPARSGVGGMVGRGMFDITGGLLGGERGSPVTRLAERGLGSYAFRGSLSAGPTRTYA